MANFRKSIFGTSQRMMPENRTGMMPNASVETGEVIPRPITIKVGKAATPYRPVTPTSRFKGKTR